MFSRRSILCLVLIAVTLIVYEPVWRFPFIKYDDFDYVFENPPMRSGLTWPNIVWAFTTFHAANYHPLTWISLLLDCSLFGVTSGPMHVENVLWHAASAVLLLILLDNATGQLWPSAFVASVFALHPTHVESVAWIAERKDVLSCFFFLLALLWYVRFAQSAEKSRRWSYITMLFFCMCGLLAKSMLATFPFVLILLDFWPLRQFKRENALRLIVEKLPLMVPALLASLATYRSQKAIEASVRSIPISLRASNAALSYCGYLHKFFWPVDLSVLYPYRFHPSLIAVVGAAGALIAVTVLFVKVSRTRQYPVIGWLWFLGTLVPVIGVVQVGPQSMADRYLYIPSIGISIIVAWGARDWLQRSEQWIPKEFISRITSAAAAAILLTLAVLCRQQVGYWRNLETLFEHASRMMNGNAIADVQLGYAAAARGDVPAARQHYEAALKADPSNFAAEFNLGNLLLKDKPDVAIRHFARAAADDPTAAEAPLNWGVALLRLKDPAGAFEHLHAAEQLDPDAYDPHYNLGQLLLNAGRSAGAQGEFMLALKARPGDPAASRGLKMALALDKH